MLEMDRRVVYAKYRLVPESTGDPDEVDFRLHLPRLPEQYPMLVADCVHNLRCVLDHLVSQLAEQHAPDRPQPEKRRNQFPLCWSVEEFREQVSRGRLNGLPDSAVELVATMQPFTYGFQSFGVLNELENQDKHRGLMIVGSVARSIFSDTVEAQGIQLPFRSWADPVWDGRVFFRLNRRWAPASFDELRARPVEARGTMQVLFLEGIAAGWNVPDTLRHFTALVEDDVLPKFRPHFIEQAG